MAWEDFKRGSVRGVTGDFPLDELRAAIKRIRREYLPRFGRNPYLAELLHALLAVVEANPSAYVADERLPTLDALVSSLGGLGAFEHIDPSEFKGALDAESDDFLIFPRVMPSGQQSRESAVVRGAVTSSGERELLCRYAILTSSLTDRMAQSLIRKCVLQDLLGYDVVDGGLSVRFERRADGTKELR